MNFRGVNFVSVLRMKGGRACMVLCDVADTCELEGPDDIYVKDMKCSLGVLY